MTAPSVTASVGPTRARRLAVGVGLAATVALVVTAAFIWVRTGFRVTGGYVPLVVPIALSAALAYAGTGAVIQLRRREVRIGWVLAAMGLLIAAIYVGFSLGYATRRAGRHGGHGRTRLGRHALAGGRHPGGDLRPHLPDRPPHRPSLAVGQPARLDRFSGARDGPARHRYRPSGSWGSHGGGVAAGALSRGRR